MVLVLNEVNVLVWACVVRVSGTAFHSTERCYASVEFSSAAGLLILVIFIAIDHAKAK